MSITNNKLLYSYKQIHTLIKNSSLEIKNKCDIDVIIAIGGGGLIPARILRIYIDKPIYVISVKLYNDKDTLNDTIDIVQWLSTNFKNKNVLIVDEINDTGTTLDFCINKLQRENELTNFSVFAIHDKNKIKNKEIKDYKHYFVGEKISDQWVVYPWDME